MCVPWELNPQPFALLTQCSTTDPQEHVFTCDLSLFCLFLALSPHTHTHTHTHFLFDVFITNWKEICKFPNIVNHPHLVVGMKCPLSDPRCTFHFFPTIFFSFFFISFFFFFFLHNNCDTKRNIGRYGAITILCYTNKSIIIFFIPNKKVTVWSLYFILLIRNNYY